MKKALGVIAAAAVVFVLAHAGLRREAGNSARPILLGFVQVSAEGAWRQANSISIQNAAREAGVDLIISVGMNNKENQIREMRELIAQNVDVIAFSPSRKDGWDPVLNEAKSAGIPVIVLDRAIDTRDASLFATHIGSDMVEQGRRAARWLIRTMDTRKPQGIVRIVELRGVEGSSPEIHRKKGFNEIVRANPRFRIIDSEPANYTIAKSREVMGNFFKSCDGRIDAVFAHNDEMAIGAAEAVREYGLKPGKDVVIISVDATKKAFESMIAGDINCTIECNPLLGPVLIQTVKDIVEGRPVPKRIIPVEKDYPAETARAEIGNRSY